MYVQSILAVVLGGYWAVFNPVQPYDHKRVVARFHLAGREELQQAIDSAMQAREEWERTPFEERSEFIVSVALMLTVSSPEPPFSCAWPTC